MTHITTLFNPQKNALQVSFVGDNLGWKGDSDSGLEDVSSLAGREDGVVRVCSFGTLFITNFYKSPSLLIRLLLLYRTSMSQMEGAVVCLRMFCGKIQFELLPTAAVMEWYR